MCASSPTWKTWKWRWATPPAKVIINARTGSVVINQSVRLGACAVAHGGLSVVVSSTPIVACRKAGGQEGRHPHPRGHPVQRARQRRPGRNREVAQCPGRQCAGSDRHPAGHQGRGRAEGRTQRRSSDAHRSRPCIAGRGWPLARRAAARRRARPQGGGARRQSNRCSRRWCSRACATPPPRPTHAGADNFTGMLDAQLAKQLSGRPHGWPT